MITLRNFSTSILNAAAALALSFALISGTVSMPAGTATPTNGAAVSSVYSA